MKPVTPRLKHEIAVLVIMVLMVAGYFVVTGMNKPSTGSTTAKPLNTTFDTNALNQVEKKDSRFPSIVPNDLGRPDPYAP